MVLLFLIILRKFKIFDILSLVNLNGIYSINWLFSFLENDMVLVFALLLHTPALYSLIYRIYYFLFYLLKLKDLIFKKIDHIKSPTYDYYDSESRSGLINFYKMYTNQSVFNMFHFCFYTREKSTVLYKISKLFSHLSRNSIKYSIILMLPSTHLIRLLVFWLEIFWNFKKWKREVHARDISLIKTFILIKDRKSSILFWINLTKCGGLEKKIYIYNNKITSNNYSVFFFIVTKSARDSWNYKNMRQLACKVYGMHFCPPYFGEGGLMYYKKEAIRFEDEDGNLMVSPKHYATRDFNKVMGSEFENIQVYSIASSGSQSYKNNSIVFKEFKQLHSPTFVKTHPSAHSSLTIKQVDSFSTEFDFSGKPILYYVDIEFTKRKEAFAYLLNKNYGANMSSYQDLYNPYDILSTKNKRWVDKTYNYALMYNSEVLKHRGGLSDEQFCILQKFTASKFDLLLENEENLEHLNSNVSSLDEMLYVILSSKM